MANRKVLLLIDNFSACILSLKIVDDKGGLLNIRVEFFSTNVISVF